ncbi:unnamed protein product [Mucor hiemalis]
MNQYRGYEQDQRNNSSLRGHGLLEHIVNMLENDETDKFVQLLWTSEVEGIDERGAALLKMIRYILTSFHLVFSDVPLLTQNHERTPFTENIVPSLLALSKITGFVEFKWCDTEFTSNKYLQSSEYDYECTNRCVQDVPISSMRNA